MFVSVERGFVPFTLVLLLAVLAGCTSVPRELPANGSSPPAACVENAACDDAEYCAKPVGECEGEGECRERPEVCTQVFAPVCGCDGQTYANACTAAAEGVNIEHRGECEDGEGRG